MKKDNRRNVSVISDDNAKDKKQGVNVGLDDATHAWLKKWADSKGTKMAPIVRELVLREKRRLGSKSIVAPLLEGNET